jgi:hypothetical protein
MELKDGDKIVYIGERYGPQIPGKTYTILGYPFKKSGVVIFYFVREVASPMFLNEIIRTDIITSLEKIIYGVE